MSEVYVRCSLAECIRRNVKELYRMALDGELTTSPACPIRQGTRALRLVLDAGRETPEESAGRLLRFLTANGYVQVSG